MWFISKLMYVPLCPLLSFEITTGWWVEDPLLYLLPLVGDGQLSGNLRALARLDLWLLWDTPVAQPICFLSLVTLSLLSLSFLWVLEYRLFDPRKCLVSSLCMRQTFFVVLTVSAVAVLTHFGSWMDLHGLGHGCCCYHLVPGPLWPEEAFLERASDSLALGHGAVWMLPVVLVLLHEVFCCLLRGDAELCKMKLRKVPCFSLTHHHSVPEFPSIC